MGPCLKNDQRTLAGQRRNQARTKMNEAAVDLVSQALQNGVPAQYVLFDSWYSSPKMFDLINQLGLDGVGMLKSVPRRFTIAIVSACIPLRRSTSDSRQKGVSLKKAPLTSIVVSLKVYRALN